MRGTRGRKRRGEMRKRTRERNACTERGAEEKRKGRREGERFISIFINQLVIVGKCSSLTMTVWNPNRPIIIILVMETKLSLGKFFDKWKAILSPRILSARKLFPLAELVHSQIKLSPSNDFVLGVYFPHWSKSHMWLSMVLESHMAFQFWKGMWCFLYLLKDGNIDHEREM